MIKENIIKIAEELISKIEGLYEENAIEVSEKLVNETYKFLIDLNIKTNKWFDVDNKNNICVLNINNKKDNCRYLSFEEYEITEVTVNNAIWTALELNDIEFSDTKNKWVY